MAGDGDIGGDAARTWSVIAALLVTLVAVAALAIVLPEDATTRAAGPATGAAAGAAHAGVDRSGMDHSSMAGGSMSAASMGVGPPPVWDDGTPAVPTRHIGPQGSTGQFVAKCLYSHSALVDPIVFPGKVGRSHRHDFYGSTSVDEFSTGATLRRSSTTTCDKPGDDAAYWQPTLYDGDTAVLPSELEAYYRAAPGVDPTSVRPFPAGLALIAGDALATTPQTGEAAGWTCGSGSELLQEPPSCPPTAPLHLVLTFPDCWDGQHLDSPDHRTHATYSRQGSCPASHPVPVPQLTLSIKFPISGAGHDLRLASGNVFSAHGDFLNGWHPAALEREVDQCIHRGVVCDLASNREEDGPFFAQ